MKFYYTFLLIYLLIGLYKAVYIYNISQVFNFFETKGKINKTDLDTIKAYLSKTFDDVYAFNEISKNPPQPDFDNKYHNKINIQNEINNINTNHESFYPFYQDLKRILSKLKDSHTEITFKEPKLHLDYIYFTDPIELYIKNVNNEPKVFAEAANINEKFKQYFKNNETVFSTINNNLKNPIKLIKGKDPFDYIREFCQEYNNLRNEHGYFSYSFYLHNKIALNACPLSLEDLINFNVTYESGDSFITDFILLSSSKLFEEENNLFFEGGEINQENIKKINEDIIYLPEIKQFPVKLITYDNFGINTHYAENMKKINEDIKWDYNYDELFKCRVDAKNEVNVIFINSYYGDFNKYINNIINCVELFDKNDYKIIMINCMNSGGYVTLSQTLLELLSPYTSINLYSSLRATDSIINNYNTALYDTEGNAVESTKLFKNKINVDYDGGVSDTIISPFLMIGKKEKKAIYDVKSKFKNPRKPTDIIIFTEGFSFSAASMFIKYLQYYGGGITVGYFGDPQKRQRPFDSSLSPSPILYTDILKIISKNFAYLYDNYGIQMQFAAFQTFSHPENLKVPLEFEVNPVDVISDIYELYTDDKYDEFISEAKSIFKRYENQCNPNNKKLYLIVNECDKNFTDEHGHGGYVCGNDGTWKPECVMTYCDSGYVIDYKNNKCLIDKVLQDNNNYTLIIIILSIIIGICIIVLIILIVVYCENRKKKNLEAKNIYEDNNLNLGLEPNINQKEV